MLIVGSQQVDLCQVRVPYQSTWYDGMEFGDQVFVRSRAFPLSARERAIHWCQATLERGRFCVLVEDCQAGQYVLYYKIRSAACTSKRATLPESVAC